MVKKALLYFVISLIPLMVFAYFNRNKIRNILYVSFFTSETYSNEKFKRNLNYRLFTPKKSSREKYPLLLYLHPYGDNGTDNKKQISNLVLEWAKNKNQSEFPCYILAPQCPAGMEWVDKGSMGTPFKHYSQDSAPERDEMKMIVEVINQMHHTFPIDSSRIYVIGHSMGGAIALTLGLHHADRVLGLGLIGTGARLKVAPEIIELASNEKTFPTAVKMIISWAFSSSADARLVELASQRMLEIAPAVLHSDFIACNEFDVISVLSGINLPTLVLCGSDDRLTPWRYSQYLSEHIHSADLITIPDAGHMVMLESQSAVTKALNDFMAEIPY